MKYIKKNQNRIFLIIILSVVLIFSIVLLHIINSHKSHYNPFINYNNSMKTATYITQLLCPNISYVYVFPYESSRVNGNLTYKEKISLKRSSCLRDINSNVCYSNIEYSNGNCKASAKYIDIFNIEKSIKRQSYFITDNTVQHISNLNNITDYNYYDLWIGFNKPVQLKKLIGSFSRVMKQYNNGNYGIRWIPIQTSYNKYDITIGIRGNLSWNCIGEKMGSQITTQFIQNDYYDQENYFKSSIQFLVKNQVETNVLLKSGLFGSISTINFKDRLNYINAHGISAIGIVLYGDLKFLKQIHLDNSSNLMLIKDS